MTLPLTLLTFAEDAVQTGPSTGLLLLTVFLLAIFVGVEIIAKIPPTLHTPLMSGSNAISGITLVGALLSLQTGYPMVGKVLGCAAVILATINVVGGFLVTHRMLGMFRRKKQAPVGRPSKAVRQKLPP